MDITGNFEISIDMKCSSVNKSNFGIGLYDTHTGQNYNALKRLQTMIYSGTYGAYATNNGTVLWNGVNTGVLSNNTWYTLYLKHENGVITSKIFNGNTEIISKTTNMDISNFPYFNITIARQDNIPVINWKNLKIIKL